MGWLMLLLAYLVGPVLVMGLMNWIISGFPLPWGKPRKGFPDNGFLIFLGGVAVIVPALAYEIFVAHYVFQGLTYALGMVFGTV